jgi:hypothetical protein
MYLDPSRQGLAFTRRYGYDMDVMTDYVPGNRALWIRNLGSSPELGFYDYMDAEYNPDNARQPGIQFWARREPAMPFIGTKACGTWASPRRRLRRANQPLFGHD